MKKSILFLTTVAVLSGAFLLFNNKDSKEFNQTKPGYHEQWLEMKTMGTGIVPEGLMDQWHKQGKNLRRADGAIISMNEIGPGNVAGRIRGLLIDKTNENHILAAGISGGLWTSWDKGQNWDVINDQEITLNVSCIDQSESNPAMIYYGTGEGSGNSVGFGGSGVFKSIDTGKTFTKLSATNGSDFNSSWKIKVDPNDEDIVYLATDNRGLFRTVDGGASWTKVLTSSNEMNDLDVLPDGKVFVTIKGGGIFYSEDGSSGTFTKLSGSPIPASSFARIELSYCRDQSNVIYAVFSNPDAGYNGTIKGVYRSDDTGKIWVSKTIPSTTAVRASFTWYCKILEVHPTNPDKIFLASVSPGYSLNGGQTWTSASNPHADYHSASINPNNPEELLVGNDGGIHLYNWANMKVSTSLNNSINITQFYHGSHHPTSLTFAGGTQDNGTRYSLNATSVFSRINSGDGAFTHINQQIPSVVYASSQNGNIRRLEMGTVLPTSNIGIKNELDANNNGTIDEGARFINPYWMNYNNGFQLFFVTNKGVWRSNNSGDNWVKITGLRPSAYSVGISHDDDPTIYIGGSSVFTRVDNAGTVAAGTNEVNLINKLPALSGQFAACIRVHPNDKSRAYVGLSNYNSNSRLYEVIYADTDTPQTVSLGDNLPSNLPINSFDFDPANPDSVFVVGTDYGLYSTKDRGATWSKQADVPNVSVNTVQIRKSDRRVFIYTHGRGVFSGMLINTNNVKVVQTEPDIELTIYPNPGKDVIQLATKHSSSITYTIFDAKGKRLKAAFLRDNGKINVAGLPSGRYFILVKQDGMQKTIQWVKE